MKSLIATLAAVVLCSTLARADVPVFTTPAGGNFNVVGAQHYMEDIVLGGSGAYQLNNVTLGLSATGVSDADPQQSVLLEFYSAPSTDPASPNALLASAMIAAVRVELNGIPIGTSEGSYVLNIATANVVLTAGLNYGFVVSLIQSDGAGGFDYSDTVNGRFTTTSPTLGSNALANKVWVDGVNDNPPFSGDGTGGSTYDNVFQGAEQTQLGQAAANIRLSITANPVPEPSALVFSGVAGCLMLGAFLRLRSAKSVA